MCLLFLLSLFTVEIPKCAFSCVEVYEVTVNFWHALSRRI
jgi:hypothetical protein